MRHFHKHHDYLQSTISLKNGHTSSTSSQSNPIQTLKTFHVAKDPKLANAKEVVHSRRKEACLRCRSKKLRCGGEQPSCTTCLKWRRQCAYSAEEMKPTGPRSIAELSTYLASLEEKLQSMLASKSRKTLAPDVGSNGTSGSQPDAVLGEDPQNKTKVSRATSVDNDITPGDREKILTLYFRYHHRVGCYIDPSYFFQSLHAEDPNLQPHPALIDVMILTGILLAGLAMQNHLLPSTLPDVTSFLSQIHRKLGRSLEQVDRVLDHLQASLILCRWYNYHNRLQEAQYLASSCFSIAVDLQLHRLSGDIVRQDLGLTPPSNFWDGTILGPPRDRYEVYSRIFTFWSAYSCERLMGLITGLPTACDGIAITTIWPRPMDELGLICSSTCEGNCPMCHLHSVKELLAGDIEPRPAGGSIFVTIQWKTTVLLGRAVELTSSIESLEAGDSLGLEDAIRSINILANAIQVFDSSISQINQYLPPHQSLKSNTDPRRLCVSLEARVATCASRVHILRCIETASKLLTTSTDKDKYLITTIDSRARATFMGLIPNDGFSFIEKRFALAQTGIKLAHEVARQDVEDDPAGFKTTRWIAHVPYVTAYMMPPMVLAVVETIHDLEAQMLVLPADSPAYQSLSVRLEDAEYTFTQGLEFLNLLSNHLFALTIQIDKIEAARYSNVPFRI